MDTISVLIVDDHAIVRTGLTTLLEAKGGIDVVGEADNGASAVKKALRLRPDVVIMDIMMPGLDGITATCEILSQLPGTKVLILTTSTVAADLALARRAGALGIVAKSADNADLIKAIRAVSAGKSVISEEIEELMNAGEQAPELTSRQAEILQLVSKGLSNPDIARIIGVSTITVKKHMESLLARLGAANRSEAISIAIRLGLLKV